MKETAITTEAPMSTPDVLIRLARPEDREALTRLAELDSGRAPVGPALVAEVRGDIWAALSLDDRSAVADPFRPTGELVALLAERAGQLVRGRTPRPRRRSRLHRRHAVA